MIYGDQLETGEGRREGRGVQTHKQMHQHSRRQHRLIADCIYDKQYAHSLKRVRCLPKIGLEAP